MRLVTVIGGSGFVGTHLCQLLADRNVPFQIIDLKVSQRFPAQCSIVDVRDIETLRSTVRGDVLVHLAAIHRDDVAEKGRYYDTNVIGAQNVVQLCRELGIRKTIFVSSVAVYGTSPNPKAETGETKPENEYGRTKLMAEEIFRAWHNETGNCLTIVRPTVIFGPGNRGNVYVLFRQVASGRFVIVGAGHNKKSLAYIGNFAEFLYACVVESTDFAVYNYVDEPNLSVNELIEEVARTFKRDHRRVLRLPYPLGLMLGYIADAIAFIIRRKLSISSTRVRKFCASTEFVANRLPAGFKPVVDLREAIKVTIESEFVTLDPDREVFHTE